MLALNKKLVKILSIFIVFISLFKYDSFAIVKPTNDFYVNDYAGVIDSETEKYIIDIGAKLYNKTGAQIVVVTVKSLDGKSIEDYALETFRNFGIGDSKKNNGVLFIVSTGDRDVRIEVRVWIRRSYN